MSTVCPACGGDLQRLVSDAGDSPFVCSDCAWSSAPADVARLGGFVVDLPVNGTDPIVFFFQCPCGFKTNEAATMIEHQRREHRRGH